MVTWTAQLDASAPDIAAGHVREAEKALRVRFPPAFVAIATKYPKAEPDPKNLIIGDFGTAVGHLLHFESKSDFYHIVNRIFPVEDVLDKGIIPFAEDIGGNLYCFNYRGEGAVSSVDFWSVDTGLVPLAESFEAFLGLLVDGDTVSEILMARATAPGDEQRPGGA